MQANPFAERQTEAESINGHVSHLALLAGIAHCSEDAGGLPPVAPAMVARCLFSLTAHCDTPMPFQAAKEVLWEIGNLIQDHTREDAHVHVAPLEDARRELGHSAMQAFFECSMRGDLAAAVRIVDAIQTEYDDPSRAFTECLNLGANLVMSMGVSFHRFEDEEH